MKVGNNQTKHKKAASSLNSLRKFLSTGKKDVKKTSRHVKVESMQNPLKEKINFENKNNAEEISNVKLDGDFTTKTITYHIKENKDRFLKADFSDYEDVIFKTSDMRKPSKLTDKIKP